MNFGGILHTLGIVAEIVLCLAAVVWVALRCLQRFAVEGWIDENGTERIGVRPEEADHAIAHGNYGDGSLVRPTDFPRPTGSAYLRTETVLEGGVNSERAARLTPPGQPNSRPGGGVFVCPTAPLLEGAVSFSLHHHDHSTSPQEPQHHGEC